MKTFTFTSSIFIIFIMIHIILISPCFCDTWDVFTTGNAISALYYDGTNLWCGANDGAIKWNLNDRTYEKFGTKDGLVYPNINDIAKDKSGVLWFATVRGVSSYDGKNWKRYLKEVEWYEDWTTYPLHEADSVVVDNDNHVWFGLNGGGIAEFTQTEWIRHTTDNGLSYNQASKIAYDSKNNKLYAITSYIDVWDGEKWSKLDALDLTFLGGCYCIFVDSKSRLWIGGVNSALMYDGTQTIQYDNLYRVEEIAEGPDGLIWLLPQWSYPQSFDGSNWIIYDETKGAPKDLIYTNAIAFDKNGRMIFGTNTGLFIYDGENWISLKTREYLLESNITNVLFNPNDGKVWFSYWDAGLGSFDGEHWQTTYDIYNDFLGNISTLFYNSDSIWYFNTSGNAICEFDGINIRKIGMQDGLQVQNVKSADFDIDGNLWIGGSGPMAAMMTPDEQFTTYTSQDGLPFDNIEIVQAVQCDHSGNVWFGASLVGGIAKFDRVDNWNYFMTSDGLLNAGIKSIFEDSKGNIWVGTSDGINVIKDDEIIASYDYTNGMGEAWTDDFAEDSLGLIWTASENYIHYYDGYRWHGYTFDDGLHDYVKGITIDQNDNIWYASSSGLGKLSDRDPQVDVFAEMQASIKKKLSVSFTVLSPSDAKTVDFYFALLTTPDGRLLFYPDWTESPKSMRLDLPGKFRLYKTEVMSINLPSDTPPINVEGIYTFAVVFAKPSTLDFYGKLSAAKFEYAP